MFCAGCTNDGDIGGYEEPSAYRGHDLGYIVVGYIEKTLSVLFAHIGAKRTKNAVRDVSRLRARLGALPQVPGRFLKKATQKLL